MLILKFMTIKLRTLLQGNKTPGRNKREILFRGKVYAFSAKHVFSIIIAVFNFYLLMKGKRIFVTSAAIFQKALIFR
jgi:hypothetical protein